MRPCTVLAVVLVLAAGASQAARILGIIPTPSISHQTPFRLIGLELARRGHQVTVITTDPLREKIENYTEIDVSVTYDFWRATYDFNSLSDSVPHDMLRLLPHMGQGICEIQLDSSEMKDFIRSAPSFDVVIIERLMYQCYYGLVHKDIQKFLDEAEDGVIYFSLGSNVRGNTIPEEKRLAFLEAFAQLPQRVLWKWEAGSMPGQPDNVMTAKWWPQQDVLAHKNMRLFITQGGLQSVNEAGYFGVPMIAIPFMGDQKHNVAKIVQAGIGYRLMFKDVTVESVLKAVRTVLGDKRYQENMRQFSAVFREHQETSLDRAVWWVEYVLRHRGAPHLRSAALDLHWWQLWLLDVIAFVVIVPAAGLYLLYRAARYVTTTGATLKKKRH
ncbi:UDP-glycosyltransferase UGT5-like isoform X3 [Schistocerca gregaria]|uniref:UDP-glycosyltransferase UGT5-like isoform X3 n=1 Tax=Schistocerca gregaria TaxID=7010 RepID=UPI00211F0247|nr:UDP-glycosyltransferase UGT5-like isoform X3 [Schistocerca gregaria]